MYREKAASLPQKALLTVLHLLAVLAAAWLLFGGGIERVAGLFGTTWELATSTRRALLLACSAVYFLRTCVTLFAFLRRKVAWWEALTIALFAWIINLTFTLLGGTNPAPLGVAGAVAVGLYALGSYLNTASEWQRQRWKERPENPGHLYTGGLFRWSMHINYFGDLVLFSGFALLTGRAWAFLIPAFMAVNFIFVNIPMLDAYLQEKYGFEFEAYRQRTKRFIPWIY